MLFAHSEAPSSGLNTRLPVSMKARRRRPPGSESSMNPVLESSEGNGLKTGLLSLTPDLPNHDILYFVLFHFRDRVSCNASWLFNSLCNLEGTWTSYLPVSTSECRFSYLYGKSSTH